MILIRFLFLLTLLFSLSFSKGEVSKIFAHKEAATSAIYTAKGHQHKWGQGENIVIDAFEYNNHRYNYVSDAPIVKIRRVNNVNATGEPCGLFAEKFNGNNRQMAASFPNTNGNCDMAKVMGGRIINVGALDVFRNVGHTAKNVERVDFISPQGITAPSNVNDLSKAGHVVTEKSGNNYIQIAAILSIDANNNPTSFGPLVMVHKNYDNASNIRYGMTNIYFPDDTSIYHQNLGFYVDNTSGEQGKPWYIQTTNEALGMAFVTLEDLGVSHNQTYYGFSYFGRDVSRANDVLTDISTYPRNTGGDTADPYGGVASYFVDEELQLPISCQNSAFMFHDVPTEVSLLNLTTGIMSLHNSTLSTNKLNAAGYNKKDNFIWGYDQIKRDGTLLRIGKDSDGSYVSKEFKVPSLNGFSSYSADIDDNGHMYLKEGGKNNLNVIVIDLDPNSANYLTQIRDFHLTQKLDIHDWAFNPVDDFLYAITKGDSKLYRINPTNGTVTFKGDTGINKSGQYGASFFDKHGFFYVYNNQGGIYQIDVQNSAEAVLFSNTDAVNKNDGAMCSDVEVIQPPKLYISNEEIEEGNSGTKNLEFTVALDKNSNSNVTFDYQVFDGDSNTVIKNATAPSDHTNISGSATLSGDTQTYTILVPIIGDEVVEDDEKFKIVISNIQGAIVGNATATGTILNDDSAISWGTPTDLDEDNDGILDEIEFGDYPNLVQNPSFETDDCMDATRFPNAFTGRDGTFLGDDYNNNQIANWNYTSNIDCWVEGNSFALTDYGTQYIDLQGNLKVYGSGSEKIVAQNHLTQTITTIPGKTYRFSFWWGEDVGHKVGEPIVFTMKVIDATNNTMLSNETLRETAGGREQFEYAGPNTWYNYEAFFVATSSETKLDFSATPPAGNLSAGADIDMVSVKEVADHDEDGVPDFLDLDSDNDGIPDNIEAQSTQNYIKPNKVFDANGVDTAYTSGLIPVDTDGDATADYLDLDSDDDGIFDIEESGLGNNDADGDGRTNAPIGVNGLDNSATHEHNDTLTDVNGMAYENSQFKLQDTDNDTSLNGSSATPMGVDFDYRDNVITSNVTDLDQDNDGILDSIEYGSCSEGIQTLMSFDDFGTGGRTTTPYTTYCYEDGSGSDISCQVDKGITYWEGNSNVNDGEYAIVQHPNPDASSFGTWSQIGDHTGNDAGRMMVVNASLQPDEFYRRTYSVIPRANMTVDLWILNVVKAGSDIILPNISFKLENMNGEQVGEIINTGDIPENSVWNHYTLSINPEGNSQIQVVLANNAPGGGGNDLALDDIRIRQTFCDNDGDGIADYLDLDSDNDGIPDNIEAQSTQNYIKPNKVFNDAGVDTAYANLLNGGLTPVDTDGDGTADYLDLDSDDDGIFDIEESGLGNNDSDNDGRTNEEVGENGLDNSNTHEQDDSIDDVNGMAYENSIFTLKDSDNDTQADGSNATPMSVDFNYRDNNSFNLINLVAEYRFDECYWNGTEGEVKDSSGNNLHGTAKGNANTAEDGEIGRTAYFDGDNDFVEIPNNEKIQLNADASWSLWINPEDITKGRQGLLFKHYNNEFELIMEPNGYISFYHGDGAWEEMTEPRNARVIQGQWNHVVITRDNSTKTLAWYINSQKIGTYTYTKEPLVSNKILTIGVRNSYKAYGFKGKIDEVKLFNSTLSDETIQKIYENENAGKNWNALTDEAPREAEGCIVPPRVSIDDITKKEGDSGTTEFTFVVSLDSSSPMATNVSYNLSDGTAIVIDDYLEQNGLITFNAGETQKTITVEVVGDKLIEDNEDFYVNLTLPSTLIFEDDQGVGTIINDDAPKLSIERTNSNTVNNDTEENRKSFYTQISGRDFNYAIVSYEEKNLYAIEDITVKIELIDKNSTTIHDVIYGTTYLYLSDERSRFNQTAIDDLAIQRATRNAIFKISYLLDENGTLIHGQYNNEADYNTKKYTNNNQETYGYSDNFAIRPASYRINIMDKDENNNTVSYRINNQDINTPLNLVAEHDYKVEIIATKYNSQNRALNYGQIEYEELNASLVFEDKIACNDTNEHKLNYKFIDGNVTKPFSHDNNGAYRLTILDNNWTAIDMNGGCILDDASISVDGNSKSGCNISSNLDSTHHDIELKFHPYIFDINNTLSNIHNNKDYLYMSDLNTSTAMAVQLDSIIKALGEKGKVLSNFTTSCIEDDISLPLGLNFSFLSDEGESNRTEYTIPKTIKNSISKERTKIIPQQIVQFNTKINQANESTINSNTVTPLSDLNISREFLDENNGTMSVSILYNIERFFNEPSNPIKVNFVSLDLNVSKFEAKREGENKIPKASGEINKTKVFYFARVASYLEHYPETNKNSINTPLFVEVYCRTNDITQDWCRETMQLDEHNITENGLKTSNGWYLATEHDSTTEGVVSNLESNTTKITTNYIEVNGDMNEIKTSHVADKITEKVTAEIQITTNEWLKFKLNPSYFVTMTPVGGMTGISPNADGDIGYNLMRDNNGSLNGMIEHNGKIAW